MPDTLGRIIEKIQGEESCWDGMLEMKLYKDRSSVPELLEYIYDESWLVRMCVAEKLGEFRDARAIRPLIYLFRDPDRHVQKKSFLSLAHFGDKALPDLVDGLNHLDHDFRVMLSERILTFGPSVIPDLVALMLKQDWVIANHILYLIWELGGEGAEQALVEALQYPLTRKSAIVLLGFLGKSFATPHLIRFFVVPGLKRMVLFSLSRLSSIQARTFIVDILKQSSLSLRQLAERLIVQKGRVYLKPLVLALKDPAQDPLILCRMIEKIGPKPVMPFIREMAQKDDTIRHLTLRLRRSY